MQKTGLRILQDNSAAFQLALKRLADDVVMVGVPARDGDRRPAPGQGKYVESVNNPTIAYWMNYGVPSANIPAREFMAPGIRSAQAYLVQSFTKAGEAAIAGDRARSDNYLSRAGIYAVNHIRAKITAGPFDPLAPSTISARKRRGRTGTRPLIDTGQLRQSINYVIRTRAQIAEENE